MSKFKEYLKSIDNKKKIILGSSIGVIFLILGSIASYIIWNSTIAANNDAEQPKRDLIVQEVAESVNKYTGDKKDFHFNKYWADMSGGIYTVTEKDNVTDVQYKKNMGNEWAYISAPVEGKFSDFKYINLKVTGEKGKKLFLKLEESAIELKAKFFTLNGKEQILTMDISDIKSKKKLDALKQVMLFASPGEIENGSFVITDAWFSTESPTVNKYLGDKQDFHFNKYWEDVFNHGIAIEEDNGIATMTFKKQPDNNWILASTAIDGKFSDFNYVSLKVKGDAGQKFLLKLENGDKVYGEKLVELSGEEEAVVVELKKDVEGLDSLKEVRVFPNAGEPEGGKVDILDAWFSVEKPQGLKEAGEAVPSGAESSYINGWKIEEWTKYSFKDVNGLTKVTYDNPAPWASLTYNVEGKISGNNLFNLYLNSEGCDHVMIKLRGKFKNVDPVGGFNVYEEVEIFNGKIKQGETNLQIDIADAVKELGHVVDVVMFVESNQDVKGLDRVGSLTFGQPKFTFGEAINNSDLSNNEWVVGEWTGYTSEIKDGFTRIKYDNVQPWANISYNIKNLLKDNNILELKLNSNGSDHIQIKLRGKYLNSDPGYKVYEEALVFDGKLNNGEKTLKLDLTEAINQLGRQNITDIMMFIESNQMVSGLDRKGSLDIYTPIFSKGTITDANPVNPENPNQNNTEWIVEEWTGYKAEVKDGFTRIQYDNIEPWANIRYNIKGMLKDNNTLELKLNSNGSDHVQIKLRGKYLNSDPGYKVYEEALVYDSKLNSGEKILKLDLTEAINQLGRENITELMMFIESNQTVSGLDRKGSLDIYTPVFNKEIATNPTPGQPENPGETEEPGNEEKNEWVVEEWTGYKAEIKDGFTRIQYDNVQPWASITYNIKDMLKDNNTLELKLNSNGADHVQIKIRGKYLNSDPGYKVYEEELAFEGKLNSGENVLKLNLSDIINKLGRENITDIVMFIESNDTISELDKKGSLDIYTPIFNKEVTTNPEQPEVPEQPENPEQPEEPGNEEKNEWVVEEWTGYKAEIKDGFTRIQYDNVQPWASITYNIKDMLKDNSTLKLKLNSNGSDHVQIKIRGKYLNSDPGYKVYEEELAFEGKLNSGENVLKLNLSDIINKLGRENITDIVMFIESNDTISELDKKGSLDIYTPIFNKEVTTNPEQPEVPEQPENPEQPEEPGTPEEPEVINGIKKFELNITKEQLEKIGGQISNVILFVESDGTITDVDRNGEIELLETALLDKEGNKKKINEWTTDVNWNQYQISTEEAKTIIKYNNVAPWATVWGKVPEDNTYNDKVSIIFNTNGCDHLTVKVRGTNGEEVELGKDYVKNMTDSEKPENSTPEEPVNNLINVDINDEVLNKLGGTIRKVLIFVESNPYGGTFDKNGKLEIVETALQNESGNKMNINEWTTDKGWNQYQISKENNKTIVEYNNVKDWAHIISQDIDYKEGYNKLELKLNSIGCDHITVKLIGKDDTLQEEIKSINLEQ